MIRMHGTEEQKRAPPAEARGVRDPRRVLDDGAARRLGRAVDPDDRRPRRRRVRRSAARRCGSRTAGAPGIIMLLAKTDPTADPPHKGMTGFIVEKEPETEPAGPDDPDARAQEARLQGRGVDRARLRRLPHPGLERPRRRGGDRPRVPVLHERHRGRAASTSPRAASASPRPPSTTRCATRSEREAFGKKIGHHQTVQLMLAKMATRAEAARLLVAPGRAEQGLGRARRPRGGDGQVLRHRGGAGQRARLHAHPRRLRLLARVPPGALLPRRAAAPHRRGLERDPAAHHREEAARALRR